MTLKWVFINTLFFLLCYHFAQAFTLNPAYNKGWANSEISIRWNPSNCTVPAGKTVDEYEVLISESLNYWNNIPSSSLKIKYLGQTKLSISSGTWTWTDFRILLFCTSANTYTWPYGAAANDAVTVNGSTGTNINYGYVYLPSGYGNTTSLSDDEYLREGFLNLIHNVGHVLGFGHSENAESIMGYNGNYYSKIFFGITPLVAADDALAASFLYPKRNADARLFGCSTANAQDVNWSHKGVYGNTRRDMVASVQWFIEITVQVFLVYFGTYFWKRRPGRKKLKSDSEN